VTDLANTPGIKDQDDRPRTETVAAMNKKYGRSTSEDVIPKATYRGMDADNKQATVWTSLFAREPGSQTAYNIVRPSSTRDDMIAVHKEAENSGWKTRRLRFANSFPSRRGQVFLAERGVKIR